MNGGEPFSATRPGLIAGRVSRSIGFAFNFDNPSGVKLLGNTLYERLQAHVARAADRMQSSEADRQLDVALHNHGLIKVGGKYARPQEKAKNLSLAVWLNIVDACNLGCFYCYIPELRKNVDPRQLSGGRLAMKAETADIVANSLIAYCVEHGLAQLGVKFAGGEPTLALGQVDSFARLITKLGSEAGVKVNFGMLTNGVFEFDSVFPVISKWDVAVGISIDGAAGSHDRIRFTHDANGVRVGTWDRVIENAKRLLENGVRPYFLYTITPKNLADVEEFAATVHGMGCGFRLSLERGHRAIDQHQQAVTSDYLRNFYRRLARSLSTEMSFERDARFAEWKLTARKNIACSTCRGYVAVGSNGEVASCQMALDRPVGSLGRGALADAIDAFGRDQDGRLLRQPEKKVGGCTRCEFRYVCAGGCPQHTRNVWGDLDRPSPWCQVYGDLAPAYVEASAVHLARRFAAKRQFIPAT